MEAAASLTVRSTSQCLAVVSAPGAHAVCRQRRAAGTAVQLGRTLRRRRAPCGPRLRALPPELSEILSPKLVPGSPSDTGDVSSLIPVSALMLLFYLVSNWVVPELVLKRLQQPTAEDGDTAAAAASTAAADDDKIRMKVKKKKKSKKETTKV